MVATSHCGSSEAGRSCVLLLILLFAVRIPAQATWTGPAVDPWSTAAHGSPGAVLATDEVVLSAPATPSASDGGAAEAAPPSADHRLVQDVYVKLDGNDANDGSPDHPLRTIAAAKTRILVDGTIHLEGPGKYTETVVIDFAFSLVGDVPGVEIAPVPGRQVAILVAATGSAANPIRIANLFVQGVVSGIVIDGPVDFLELTDVTLRGNSARDIQVTNAAVLNQAVFTRVVCESGVLGLDVFPAGRVQGLHVTGSQFTGTTGINVQADFGATDNELGFRDVVIDGGTQFDCTAGSLYLQKSDHVLVQDCTAAGGIIVELYLGHYRSTTFRGCSITPGSSPGSDGIAAFILDYPGSFEAGFVPGHGIIVENCVIQQFAYSGIALSSAGTPGIMRARIEGTDLRSNATGVTLAGDGLLADLGNCGGADITGLGASRGSNDLSGYTGVDPSFAIRNDSLPSDVVLAQNDEFGVSDPEDVILDDTDDPALSPVVFVAPTLVITCPPAQTFTDAGMVPLPAADLAAFALAGGVVSVPEVMLTASDGPLVAQDACRFTLTRTYSVTDPCGRSATCDQVFTITSGSPPSIVSAPLSTTVCVGEMVSFSVVATPDAGLAYQWRKDTLPIGGAIASTLVITNASAGDAGAYDCVVSNACGPVTTTAATLALGTVPIVTAPPMPVTGCPGTSFTLMVAASGTMPLGYQWRRNGMLIGGATEATYAVTAATPGDSGSYDVVVANLCGSTASAAAAVVIEDVEPPAVQGGTIGGCYPSVAEAEAAARAVTSATDNCTPAPLLAWSVVTIGTCQATITVTVTDAAVNSSAFQYTTRIDATPPVLHGVPPDATIECGENLAPPVVTATDDCVSVLAPDLLVQELGHCGNTELITRTWSVSDGCHLTVATQRVTVIDTTPPTLAFCPPDLAAVAGPGECSHVFQWTPPVATDACGPVTLTSTHAPGDAFPAGTTTVTYTATDGCGQVATCSFTVTVTGDFDGAATYLTGPRPRALAVAELGVAGNTTPLGAPAGPDVVVVNGDGDSLTVLFNDGMGIFGGPSLTLNLATGDHPIALATGHFVAGSTGVDLAVACQGTPASSIPGGVKILRNSGSGWTVFATIGLGAATEPVALAAGDLDGVPGSPDDLVVACRGTASVVGIIRDGGSFVALPPPPAGYRTPMDVAVGDLDGDGHLDVVSVESGGSPLAPERVLLHRGLGGGAFAAPERLNTRFEPRAVSIGDVDADGRANDMVIATDGATPADPAQVEVLVNLGNGQFGSTGMNPAVITPLLGGAGGSPADGRFPCDIVCGDLQHDSLLRSPGPAPAWACAQDVVVANGDPTGAPISIGRGLDCATRQFRGLTNECDIVRQASAVAIADLSGDGIAELLVTDEERGLLCVLSARVRARSTAFGAGCAGAVGVPVLSADQTAVMGGVGSVDLSNGRPWSVVVLGISAAIEERGLAPSPCTVYLASPMFTVGGLVTEGDGRMHFYFVVPAPPTAYLGAEVYFQAVVSDPAGAFASAIAASNALRVRLGF